MKKVTFLMLLIGFVSMTSCIGRNDKINQWEEYELKGKVQRLKISEYTAVEKFGEISKESLQMTTIVYFNKKGLIDSIDSYYGDDYLQRKTEIYTWDYSRHTCVIRTKLFGKVDSTSYELLQYNRQFDKLLSKTEYKADSIYDKLVWTYNDSKQLVDYTYYGANGKIIARHKDFEYNNKGELICRNMYTSDGFFDNVESYRYDDNGNLIGRKTETDQTIYKTTFEYNSENMLCREICENKNRYSSSTDITEYTYQLDKNGNFIVKTLITYYDKSFDDVYCEYIEREITYF